MPKDAGGAPATAAPLTALTAAEVSERTRYSPRKIRKLVSERHFPDPINRELAPQSWRWAAPLIDQYVRGEWKPAAA